ncbi:MAG: DUF2093 domain-containing protein [Rhizobiales bacterium]|nr:DUF2093 domain-containing protein [Hyphomicrobiales bacterium]
MNRLERGFQPPREAKLKFMQGDFRVVVPGSFVRCAVSGESIALDDLKYWNVDHQEAYASVEIALKRHLELLGRS